MRINFPFLDFRNFSFTVNGFAYLILFENNVFASFTFIGQPI